MLLNVGFDNAVVIDRIIAIIDVSSTPVKRMIEDARKNFLLVDATHGKKIKSVVVMDSNHCVLSAILPETLILRCGNRDKQPDKKIKEPDKK